ncbi:ESPR domain-containing protein [Burkholderia multivorans]|nr:ESPR domain-containing protein [Burkholderia multivorans]MBR7901672.1 ESPR domain-containing protein [Burkholderia multivorans]
MNRTYRSIWNEALGAWVAASELDSARGKPNKSAVVKAVATVALVAGAAVGNVAHAQYSAGGTGVNSNLEVTHLGRCAAH